MYGYVYVYVHVYVLVCLCMYVSCVPESPSPSNGATTGLDTQSEGLNGQRKELGTHTISQRSDTDSGGGGTDELQAGLGWEPGGSGVSLPSIIPRLRIVAPDRLSSCIVGAPAAGRHEKWAADGEGAKAHTPVRTEENTQSW